MSVGDDVEAHFERLWAQCPSSIAQVARKFKNPKGAEDNSDDPVTIEVSGSRLQVAVLTRYNR